MNQLQNLTIDELYELAKATQAEQFAEDSPIRKYTSNGSFILGLLSLKSSILDELVARRELVNDPVNDPVTEVIQHLAEVRKSYGLTYSKGKGTASARKLIKDWLKTYTIEDFKFLNLCMVKEWAGSQWEQYLTADTLYKKGTKSDGFEAKLERMRLKYSEAPKAAHSAINYEEL